MPIDRNEQPKFDLRMYIGMILFRWQIIVLCFLLTLLGGVLYIQFCPKLYLTHCKIMVYRDPNLTMRGDSSPWSSFNAHTYLLENEDIRKRVVKNLAQEWGSKVGYPGNLLLGVQAGLDRRINYTLNVNIQSRFPVYAEKFLAVLLEEHKREWNNIQRTASDSAAKVLTDELANLEDKIRQAEDALVDYLRLHDIPRADTKSTMESRYLAALMERRSQLVTELMLIEAQTPSLKNAGAETISHVYNLTRETGRVEPMSEDVELKTANSEESGISVASKPRMPAELRDKQKGEGNKDDTSRGWHDLRVKLEQLKQQESEFIKNLKPEHPQYKRLLEDIKQVQQDLQTAAKIEMGRLKARHEALTIQLNALETAEYQWKANNVLASTRRAELSRIADAVKRFEGNYNILYSRLHEMKVGEELKAEYIRTIEPVATDRDPVWPDPLKILMMVVGIGLGLGFGGAFLGQMFDNKIQTIADVENVLGIPFLGGVPYWIHGGLEKSIRPIVTEEHSTGAIEAYRALRTSLLAALGKINEKIAIVTSADSREGKTLTVLNIAILIAQMGKKVLVADMDLRRGRLHRSLGLEREPGISDVLKEGRPLKDVVVKTRIENLFLAPAGSSTDNTAELLQSADISGMLMDIRDDFDYILIDTSPVLRVTDTVIISTHGVGVVVYVARVNHTPKPMIKYSLDMLKDARILGLIMNSIEMHRISSLYYTYQYPNYAYYSNAYAYGYDYYYYGDRVGGEKVKRRRGPWEKRRRVLVDWMKNTFLPME